MLADNVGAPDLPSTQTLALSPCRVNGDPCLGRWGGLTVPSCSSREEVERGVRGCLSLNTSSPLGSCLGKLLLGSSSQIISEGPLSAVLVAFTVAATKGKGLLIWGGSGCNALYNSYALLFFFLLCLLQGDPA